MSRQSARAVATGLVRTGRAARYEPVDSFIRAEGVGTVRYWISDDGARVFRGRMLSGAEELQRGFVNAMAKAGADK